MIVPVYISELAPPTIRGRLVGLQQWAITWGIMIMFYISYGCSYINGTAAFRVPWGVQMVPGFMLLFGMTLLPESPRWLARKGRWEECRAVLALVHGKGDPNSSYVAKEYRNIEETVQFERANADVTYFELFKLKNLNRTHLGMFDQIWSQLTGMNVMMVSRAIRDSNPQLTEGDSTTLPMFSRWRDRRGPPCWFHRRSSMSSMSVRAKMPLLHWHSFRC